jgi:hypothetical protein
MNKYFCPPKVPDPAIAEQSGKSCRIVKDCEKPEPLCGKTSALGFMGVYAPRMFPRRLCAGDGYATRFIVRAGKPGLLQRTAPNRTDVARKQTFGAIAHRSVVGVSFNGTPRGRPRQARSRRRFAAARRCCQPTAQKAARGAANRIARLRQATRVREHSAGNGRDGACRRTLSADSRRTQD